MTAGERPAPTCFLHIPKCAGMSIHAALETAFGTDAVAPKRADATVLCGHTDRVHPTSIRPLLALDEQEQRDLGAYPLISGHFSASTLLAVTQPRALCTVLREPRARLLSLWSYYRLSHSLRIAWGDFPTVTLARDSFAAFVSAAWAAPVTDNAICRMVLGGHAAIPDDNFIEPGDVERVAEATVAALQRFGFVGIIERGEALWAGLSQFFGATLAPVRTNVTEQDIDPDAPPVDLAVDEDAVALLHARTAADAIVYRRALAEHVSADSQPFIDAAFIREIAKVVESGGASAAAARAAATTAGLTRKAHL